MSSFPVKISASLNLKFETKSVEIKFESTINEQTNS